MYPATEQRSPRPTSVPTVMNILINGVKQPAQINLSGVKLAQVCYAEAGLGGFEVLQSLHNQGVLELTRGVLGGGNKILDIVVEAGKVPQEGSRPTLRVGGALRESSNLKPGGGISRL